VKDLRTGKVAITSQNHGFAVCGPGGAHDISSSSSVPKKWHERSVPTEEYGALELTQINLNDHTVEGFKALDLPAMCVQYHPEASPGPHDAAHLFDDFLTMLREN
jgi:carbamoyl-phosphate synthase small subunit